MEDEVPSPVWVEDDPVLKKSVPVEEVPVPVFEKAGVVEVDDPVLEKPVPVEELPVPVFEVPVPALE